VAGSFSHHCAMMWIQERTSNAKVTVSVFHFTDRRIVRNLGLRDPKFNEFDEPGILWGAGHPGADIEAL